MSELSLSQVEQWMNEKGWENTDMYEGDRWSITGRTASGVQVAVDAPTDDLNNVFVKSPLFECHSKEEFKKAKEIVEQGNLGSGGAYIQVNAEDGLFTRAKHDVNTELDSEEIIERFEEKDVKYRLQISVPCKVGTFEELQEEGENIIEAVQNRYNQLT